jgi:hypothetical protein
MSDGQSQAGINALPIDQNRTRSALPVVAAFLGAGQMKLFAKQVEQCYARLDRQIMAHFVDGQGA